jgi:hypothetical protein
VKEIARIAGEVKGKNADSKNNHEPQDPKFQTDWTWRRRIKEAR